jgi:hypothetical protein
MALLLGYLTLSWIGVESGLNTIDAYGVIHTVNERLRTGDFPQSRPPGHPLSEFWMLPAAAWIAGGGRDLSAETYGFYQLAGGLCCLGFFWLLLRELPISAARRVPAAACLIFSPQFLIESSDGEEFLWGTAFVLATVLLMIRLSTGKMARPRLGWCVAIACAVAASGYRVEFGAMALGVVFWTLLFSDRNLAEKMGLGFFAALLLALLWGPLWIHHGAHAPWDIPLNAKTRLEIGLYKIAFDALGVFPMLPAVAFFLPAKGDSVRILPPFGKAIWGYWLPWLVVAFFVLFFFYPMKPPVILPAVAFLILWGAVRAGPWLWACFVAACIGTLLVQADCFDHRAWVGWKWKPSLWEQSLAEKSAYQGPELAAAARVAGEGRHVVIANLWPWDIEWQRKHSFWTGTALPGSAYKGWILAYQAGPGIVVSRMSLETPALFQNYARDGYDVWIDRNVYREVFMRYAVTQALPQTAAIGGVPCRIVEIGP